MKKILVALLTLTMVCGLAACGSSSSGDSSSAEATTQAAAAQSDLADKDTWIVAINATFPPFESVSDESTDSYVGIDIDIANEIGERLGKTIEFSDMQFSALVPTMESGRADMIISGISPTEERKETLDFTKSYYFPMNSVVCLKGKGYSSLDDLKGLKLAQSMGTSYAELAKTVEGAEVTELDNTPLVIQEILAGRADAGIFDASQAAEFVQQNDGIESNLIAADMTMEDTFAIALPKGSEYVEKINTVLDEMEADGTLHEIFVKYLGEDTVAEYEEMIADLDIAQQQ